MRKNIFRKKKILVSHCAHLNVATSHFFPISLLCFLCFFPLGLQPCPPLCLSACALVTLVFLFLSL